MEEARRIYTLLSRSNGLKIREISQALELDVYFVAELMFSEECNSFWYQNDESLWFAIEGALEIEEQEEEEEPLEEIISANSYRVEHFITKEHSEPFRNYLKELSKYGTISNDDTMMLFERYRDGDDKAFDLLVKSNMKHVLGYASLFTQQGVEYEDLIQEGCIGLIRSIQKFDHTRGRDFYNFAKRGILSAISKSLLEQAYFIDYPVAAVVNHHKLNRILDKQEQEFEYEPSPLNVDYDGVDEGKAMPHYYKLPYDLVGSVEFVEDMDAMQGDSDLPDAGLMAQSIEFELLMMLHSLPERDNLFIQEYYGLNGRESKSLEDIGRNNNLTRERVRQIVENTIRKIKEFKGLKKATSENRLSGMRDRVKMINGNQFQMYYLFNSQKPIEPNPAPKKSLFKHFDIHPNIEKETNQRRVQPTQPMRKGNTINKKEEKTVQTAVKKDEGKSYDLYSCILDVLKDLQCPIDEQVVAFRLSRSPYYRTVKLDDLRLLLVWMEEVECINGKYRLRELKDVNPRKKDKPQKQPTPNDNTTLLETYIQKINNLRQARIDGETIVAKPVLLLALIDGIEHGVFQNNQFLINDWLVRHYKILMNQYANHRTDDGTTPINYPYWHLQSDGFWHLNYNSKPQGSPSLVWLKNNVYNARFDTNLWKLLRDRNILNKLREYILENKLNDKEKVSVTKLASNNEASNDVLEMKKKDTILRVFKRLNRPLLPREVASEVSWFDWGGTIARPDEVKELLIKMPEIQSEGGKYRLR